MTRTRTLAAVATLAMLTVLAAAVVVIALAAPAGSQIEEQPINTRVKLLEHKVKNLEARIATLTTPEAGQCTRGPTHTTIDVYTHEDRATDADHTRIVGTFGTYLLDCGVHGVTRQHVSSGRSEKWCADLDGMSTTSSEAVPAAWATWWASMEALGVDDACTSSLSLAAAINAGTAIPEGETSRLFLHHTDPVLGWERWHTDEHPALPIIE